MPRRRGERGTTIIEVMIAATILLVAMVGFLGTLNTAAHATGVGHRRTAAAFLRQALVDRMAVIPRDRLATLFPASTWYLDSCYDGNAQLLGTQVTSTGSAYSSTYTCPAGTTYQTWVHVTPDTTNRRWQVWLYAERTDSSCTYAADPAYRPSRYRGLGCVAADLLLTD